MRSDAVQRRKTILREARSLFAQIGRDVSLEAIAHASSVGIATLYRNFATREELINEVTLDVCDELTATLSRIRATPLAPDLAWERFVRELSELKLGALTEVLSTAGHQILTAEVAHRQHEAFLLIQSELVALTRAGAVRAEITAYSVIAAIAAITRPQSEEVGETVPELRAQLLEAYVSWGRPQLVTR